MPTKKTPLLPYGEMWETERKVVDLLSSRGALTARSIERDINPKMKWQRLLDTKVLHEHETLYGLVIAFTPRGRDMVQTATGKRVTYLLGPGSIVDRAFQMDAVRALTDKGYGVERVVFKNRNSALPPRADGSRTTDQITHIVMRQPKAEQRRLNALWPGDARPVNERVEPDMWGIYPEALARPHLYATFSGGGIQAGWIDNWFRKKSNSLLIHEWRCPLLVAVPSEEHLKAILRRNWAAHVKAQAALQLEEPGAVARMDYQPLELVILPPST